MQIIQLVIHALIFVAINDAATVKPLKPLVPSEDDYTHNIIADEDKPDQYVLLWKIINKDEIQFEIHVKTSGWVGLGISPNGGMAGSDVVIGWVKDNKAYLKDCYASDKSTPIEDEKQDYKLIDGAEIDGYTILKFSRKLITCDESNDRPIKIGTQYLIFAWNNEDPLTGNNDWKYHGTNQRSQSVTNLRNYKAESIKDQVLPAGTVNYEIRMKNLQIPSKDTYYFCELFELPKFEYPVQIIQFEMLTNVKTRKNFHHVLIYECLSGFKPEKKFGQECGEVNVPGEIAINCMEKMIVAWGIGGQYNYSFPPEAGYRIDPTNDTQYYLIETHYDNPDLRKDIVDDSGVRFYYTEKLRKYDLGILALGSQGIPLSLQMPPKSNKYDVKTTCFPKCTEKFIPDEGIYVIGGLLHTHLAGRSVKTSLVRNNIVIQELLDNPTYDFNYQFLTDIQPVKVIKGDALITYCSYNTTDRKNFTYFGFGTRDEMCIDFIYYYPRVINFVGCTSRKSTNATYNFYRSLIRDSLIPSINLDEGNEDYLTKFYSRQTEFMEFFDTEVNKTDKLVKRFEEFSSSDPDDCLFCGDSSSSLIYEESIAAFIPKGNAIKEVDYCKNMANALNKSILDFGFLYIMIKTLLHYFQN